MIELDKRKKIVLISVLIVLLLIIMLKLLGRTSRTNDIDPKEFLTMEEDDGPPKESKKEENLAKGESEEDKELPDFLMVHISGQVERPGIIELENGSRLIDAVNMAGGLKKEADLDNINLAKKLKDEDKIYISKIGEDLKENFKNSPIENDNSESSLININTCSKEELMSLPGIGDKTADKILDYRESNSFEAIEDLLNVSGIGPKKFEAIEEFISTN